MDWHMDSFIHLFIHSVSHSFIHWLSQFMNYEWNTTMPRIDWLIQAADTSVLQNEHKLLTTFLAKKSVIRHSLGANEASFIEAKPGGICLRSQQLGLITDSGCRPWFCMFCERDIVPDEKGFSISQCASQRRMLRMHANKIVTYCDHSMDYDIMNPVTLLDSWNHWGPTFIDWNWGELDSDQKQHLKRQVPLPASMTFAQRSPQTKRACRTCCGRRAGLYWSKGWSR